MSTGHRRNLEVAEELGAQAKRLVAHPVLTRSRCHDDGSNVSGPALVAMVKIRDLDGADVLSRGMPEDRVGTLLAHDLAEPERQCSVGTGLEVATVSSAEPECADETTRLGVGQMSPSMTLAEGCLLEGS